MIGMNFFFILPIKMAIYIISSDAVTGVNLINLAAEEKTKLKNIIELQCSSGMSRREIQKIKLKKISFIFFSIF